MKYSSTSSVQVDQSDAAQCKTSLWREHMVAWESSSLTQSSYCQQHGISLNSFSYWRTHLKRLAVQTTERAKEKTQFLPIQLSPPQSGAPITLHAPQGLSIDIDIGFNPQLLREVLQVLVAVS